MVTSHEPSNCGADDAPGVAIDCVLVSVIRVAIATMTRAVEILLLFMILSPFWLRSHYSRSNPLDCLFRFHDFLLSRFKPFRELKQTRTDPSVVSIK